MISPKEGSVFDVFPRRTTVEWEPSEGAASYLVEWDYSSNGIWAANDRDPEVGYPTTATSFTFVFVGAQPGRWRVWPVNAAGELGQSSEWRNFRYLK